MLSQSAMEYLLTYGWAILLIALVLVLLFDLNIFDVGSLIPKANSGACIIARPNGPYSTSILSEQGLCDGTIPRYVYYFPCAWPDLSYCPNNWMNFSLSKVPKNITVSEWFWVPPSNASVQYGGVLFALSGNSPTVWVGGYSQNGRNIVGQHLCAAVFGVAGSYACSADNVTPGAWHNAIVTINDSEISIYLDSALVGTGVGGGLGNAARGYVGNQTCNCFYYGAKNILALYSGYIGNVQLYNTTFSQAGVDYVYDQGIGGAPGQLQALMAWWPLNGDPNDYSGNYQNGIASNILPASAWYDSYLQR